jgi:acylphosphatase
MSENGEELVRLHAVVEGRVQGVGFRYFVQERAVALGLAGWVRNRWDGCVEVLAEGNQGQAEKLLSELRRGPRASLVANVKPTWAPGTGEFRGFQVRMTR